MKITIIDDILNLEAENTGDEIILEWLNNNIAEFDYAERFDGQLASGTIEAI